MITFKRRNELTKAALAKVNDKHLNGEVEHFLSVDDDEQRPHDYYDAVEQSLDLADDYADRKVLVPARRVLIELGVYKVVTREYLAGITTLEGQGIAPDFKLGGLLYLFKRGLTVSDPESANGANDA